MGHAELLSSGFILTLLASGIQLATPVLLIALGEIFAERSGVLNIGIEGSCLLGALTGFLATLVSGSLTIGMIAGGLCGLFVNLFLAWMYITVQASQVVVGITFNLFAMACASYVYRLTLGEGGGALQVAMFKPIHLPFMSDIPWLGPLLFQQIPPFYMVVLLMVFFNWVLFHTSFGLALRSVGENPAAAEAAGIHVDQMRYVAVLVGGTLAGMAGAYLVLGKVGLFRDGIVSGQGFIALAVVIFGRWNPFKAALAAIAFGVADSLQLSLQIFEVNAPAQLFLALPYLMTILAVSGLLGQARQPAALLSPYRK
jgi:ABC-type uncharacterized transport system permease subunit